MIEICWETKVCCNNEISECCLCAFILSYPYYGCLMLVKALLDLSKKRELQIYFGPICSPSANWRAPPPYNSSAVAVSYKASQMTEIRRDRKYM